MVIRLFQLERNNRDLSEDDTNHLHLLFKVDVCLLVCLRHCVQVVDGQPVTHYKSLKLCHIIALIRGYNKPQYNSAPVCCVSVTIEDSLVLKVLA